MRNIKKKRNKAFDKKKKNLERQYNQLVHAFNMSFSIIRRSKVGAKI
jgi:hypothetical protein